MGHSVLAHARLRVRPPARPVRRRMIHVNFSHPPHASRNGAAPARFGAL
jgi:hypothetical protein